MVPRKRVLARWRFWELLWEPRDLWVGVYLELGVDRCVAAVYVALLPTLVVRVRVPGARVRCVWCGQPTLLDAHERYTPHRDRLVWGAQRGDCPASGYQPGECMSDEDADEAEAEDEDGSPGLI